MKTKHEKQASKPNKFQNPQKPKTLKNQIISSTQKANKPQEKARNLKNTCYQEEIANARKKKL